MIPLIVIGGVLLLLILLLSLRIRLILLFESEVVLRLKILCFGFTLYPRKPSWKKHLKKKKKRKQKPDKGHKYGEEKKRSLKDKLRLVRALTAVLIRKTRRHLRLHAAKLHIRVATGDAAKTAILYGAVSGALSYLVALLDKVTKLKATTPDVNVYADFLGEKPSAEVKLVFSLRIFGAIAILFGAVLAYLKTKLKKKNPDKSKKHAAKAAVR